MNEIKMCRTCTSNVGCGSGEIVSGATGGEFDVRVKPGKMDTWSQKATIYDIHD